MTARAQVCLRIMEVTSVTSNIRNPLLETALIRQAIRTKKPAQIAIIFI